MEESLIHKVRFTAEALFDYETTIGNIKLALPSGIQIEKDIKVEIETFIEINKKYWHKHYFKIKYLDEVYDKELFIFIKKAERMSIIQNWIIVGICETNDWNEMLEEEGLIRNWIETKIENLPYEEDWVVVRYRNKIMLQLDLIYDIGGYDAYIRTREELAGKLSRIPDKSGIIREVKPNRIKSYIKTKEFDSSTANELIGYLDEVLERERENASRNEL